MYRQPGAGAIAGCPALSGQPPPRRVASKAPTPQRRRPCGSPSLSWGAARRPSRRARRTFDGHAIVGGATARHWNARAAAGGDLRPVLGAAERRRLPVAPGSQREDAVLNSPSSSTRRRRTPTTAARAAATPSRLDRRATEAQAQVPLAEGEWGDTPLTQANCTTRTSRAASWGYLCTNAACTPGPGSGSAPRSSKKGFWQTAVRSASWRCRRTRAEGLLDRNIDIIGTRDGALRGAQARQGVDLQRAAERQVPRRHVHAADSATLIARSTRSSPP